MKPLIVLIGPTAVGKTSASLYLAPLFGGEIVNADSRQIYRHMDVGTAKPSLEERAVAPHHLIDIIDPDQEFSLALYQRQALAAIQDIHRRGKLPILVGGSGLYVRAVAEGLAIPSVPPDHNLRCELASRAQREGREVLHQELRRLDAAAAERIDARNVRRVIRALEVTLKTGTPISELQRRTPTPFRILKLGLTLRRDELYRRIDERVDWQISHGLIEETMELRRRGYGPNLPAMSSLGYKQISYYLDGQATIDEAITLAKNETHRFARQQYTWFRPTDPTIHWLEADQHTNARLAEMISAFLMQRQDDGTAMAPEDVRSAG